MTLNIIQGDDFFCWLYLKAEDEIQSASFYVVSGNPYIIPLEPTEDPEVWELRISQDITSQMFIGDFRCYTRAECRNTTIKIFTDIDKIRVCYKYNK